MTKQDFIRKISSRKFWALLTAIATAIMVLINTDAQTTEKVIALIGSFSAMVMYMFAEAYVDGQRLNNNQDEEKIPQ